MKRTPLNKESKTHRQRRLSYLKKKQIWLEQHPGCQFENELGVMCGKTWGVTNHHKKGRIGNNLLDDSTFMTVCLLHHLRIHANPHESYERGYMQKRWL